MEVAQSFCSVKYVWLSLIENRCANMLTLDHLVMAKEADQRNYPIDFAVLMHIRRHLKVLLKIWKAGYDWQSHSEDRYAHPGRALGLYPLNMSWQVLATASTPP